MQNTCTQNTGNMVFLGMHVLESQVNLGSVSVHAHRTLENAGLFAGIH